MNATLLSITEAILSDAVARTGMLKASLEVATAESVTWADGSLVCPWPGMMYTMALVPGYRIRIRTGEQLLDCHARRRGYLVLCAASGVQEPVGLDAY